MIKKMCKVLLLCGTALVFLTACGKRGGSLAENYPSVSSTEVLAEEASTSEETEDSSEEAEAASSEQDQSEESSTEDEAESDEDIVQHARTTEKIENRDRLVALLQINEPRAITANGHTLRVNDSFYENGVKTEDTMTHWYSESAFAVRSFFDGEETWLWGDRDEKLIWNYDPYYSSFPALCVYSQTEAYDQVMDRYLSYSLMSGEYLTKFSDDESGQTFETVRKVNPADELDKNVYVTDYQFDKENGFMSGYKIYKQEGKNEPVLYYTAESTLDGEELQVPTKYVEAVNNEDKRTLILKVDSGTEHEKTLSASTGKGSTFFYNRFLNGYDPVIYENEECTKPVDQSGANDDIEGYTRSE